MAVESFTPYAGLVDCGLSPWPIAELALHPDLRLSSRETWTRHPLMEDRDWDIDYLHFQGRGELNLARGKRGGDVGGDEAQRR